MSSYVIDKREYMKAAGLMYGIESAKMHPHRYFLATIKDEFTKVYELNVDSVNEQYRDNAEKDTNDYDLIFSRYCTIGRQMWTNKKQELRNGLLSFFVSSCYQIENREAAIYAKSVYYECMRKMHYDSTDGGWWGSIDI